MSLAEIELDIVKLFNTTYNDYLETGIAINVDQFPQQQVHLYRILLEKLNAGNSSYTNEEIEYYLNLILSHLQNIVTNHYETLQRSSEVIKLIYASSSIPILVNRLVDNLLVKIQEADTQNSELLDYFMHGLIYQILVVNDDQTLFDKINFNGNDFFYNKYKDYLNLYQKIAAKKSISTTSTDVKLVKMDQNFKDFEKQIVSTFASIEATADKIKADYKTLADELDKKMQDFDEFINETNYQIQLGADTSLTKINNYEKAASEILKTKQLGILWDNRAKSASIAFWISAITIAIMIFGAIAIILTYRIEISDFIKIEGLETPKETTLFALQVSRALLIAVPVILYFWAIKLLIRFFIRSLLLLDDARQRRTIMDTYLHMVKEGGVDDKSLPLIMWALCRQVPGHGSDGIEPPDFTEVVNAGLKFKKGE